jgi:hypothetical protein
MNRILARAVLLACCGLSLAACSSSMPSWLGGGKDVPLEPNLFPAAYKQEILSTMRSLLDYPAKVREAGITEPALRTAGAEQRYVVCVRANISDESGHFSGPKDRIGYFYGGHLNQFIDATPEQCGNAAYKPFPELEQMCAGASCERRR